MSAAADGVGFQEVLEALQGLLGAAVGEETAGIVWQPQLHIVNIGV